MRTLQEMSTMRPTARPVRGQPANLPLRAPVAKRRRMYRREDIDTHGIGYYGRSLPAVNVKVYKGPLDLDDATWETVRSEAGVDQRFDREWVETNVSDSLMDSLFWDTCQWNFEQIETDAEEIFGAYGVTVHHEGRSGGWAVVEGLPDIDEWDAILIAKWGKFERWAKLIAADVPYSMLVGIAINEFQVWAEADAERLECETEVEPVMVA
jgi:hypothetical protein